MRRVHIVYERGALRITVYDENGRSVETIKDGFEGVAIEGARSVLFSRGVEGSSLIAEYGDEVCLDKKGKLLEVRGCGARSREE